MKETTKNDGFGPLTQLLVLCVVVSLCLLVGFLPLYFYWVLYSGHWPTTASEFGDSFGFANVVVSACAFAFVILTLWMQRKELQLQRQEIEETREVLKQAADAQARSEKRLAAAAALTALESLRESAQSRTSLDNSLVGRCEGEILLGRIEPLIASTLKSMGIETETPSSNSWQALAESAIKQLNIALRLSSDALQSHFVFELKDQILEWKSHSPLREDPWQVAQLERDIQRFEEERDASRIDLEDRSLPMFDLTEHRYFDTVVNALSTTIGNFARSARSGGIILDTISKKE